MLEALKEEVCAQNHELPEAGLVVGSGGNVSARDPETGLIVIKPSGVKFAKLTPDTMVVVDPDGTVIEGHMQPSVDTGVHRYIYAHRPDVFGITHTHSPYATSFAARGERIPAVLTPITHFLGRDVPCAPYTSPSFIEMGEAIVKCADGGWAVLIKAHGVFTMGTSATQSTSIAMYLEEAAKTVHLAMTRGPVEELPAEEIAHCYKWFRESYGQAAKASEK